METLRIYQIEYPEDKWREPLQELRYQFDQFKTSPFVSRLMSLLDQIEEKTEMLFSDKIEELETEFGEETKELKQKVKELEDDLKMLREDFKRDGI